MKSANQVLAGRQIYCGLPAYRRIDLRKQSRRKLNQRNAAQVNRRGKSGQVANDSAAQRNHCIAALETRRAQKTERVFERAHRLVALAFWHQPVNDFELCGFETSQDAPAVEIKNCLV